MSVLRMALAAGLITVALMAPGCSSTSTSSPSKTATGSTAFASTTAGSMAAGVAAGITSSSTAAGTTAALPAITCTDPAQPVSAVVGQEITFALASNPTTGYSWQSIYDNSSFSLVNDTYTQDPKADKNLVGSGGTQYIILKALKPGQTTVTFNYRRPWEKDTAPVRQQIFNVTIR